MSVWPFSYRKRFFTHSPKLVVRSVEKLNKKHEKERNITNYDALCNRKINDEDWSI